MEASWTLPQPPNAGQAYTVDVEWTYTRSTTGGTYHHSVSESQTNTHVAGDVTLTTPSTVGPYEELWIQARIERPDHTLFTGTDLYVLALLRSPGGMYFRIDLTDDGLAFDPAANDGTFAGFLHLEEIYRELRNYGQDAIGRWAIYVFAQDVNQAQPGNEPHVAAQQIGGAFVASAVTLKFDANLPCPLKAQAAVDVA